MDLSQTIRFAFLNCLAIGVLAASASAADSAAPSDLRFTVKMLYLDANEGCDIADVNNDGRLDVIAGRNWFGAPNFIPRPLRSIEDWNGYVESNGDHAYDVDGDGWVDVVAGSFRPTELYWYRNPGEKGLQLGQLWEKKLIRDTGATTNEATYLRDMDGDGVPEWVVNSWTKQSATLAWTLHRKQVEIAPPGGAKRKGKAAEPMVETQISAEKVVIGESANGHGMAFGDLNGDGREDVLVGMGWYERPAGDWKSGPWKYHADWDLHASCPMIVRDLDGDGRNDLIWGKGHDFGLYWWRNLGPDSSGKITWKEHLIDDSFSQPHSLHMADLDGDGVEELITGKRKFAHNGRDPGGTEPPVLYYYKWDRASLTFTRYTIQEGRVGTGLQIRTADMNGDGRLDIVVAGKSGTYILFNQGPASATGGE